METSIVGVGVGITDRFRSVVEDKAARIEHLAPRAQRVDVKVTHRAYHNGRMEDDTVELTLTGKGPIVRAEATDADKFAALDMAVDKLCEQLRRAKDKRVDARNHPRGAKFEKERGELSGIDVQPASLDVIRAVATGEIPIITGNEEEERTIPPSSSARRNSSPNGCRSKRPSTGWNSSATTSSSSSTPAPTTRASSTAARAGTTA